MLSFIKKITVRNKKDTAHSHEGKHLVVRKHTSSELVQAIEKVGIHDHLCLIYKDKAEQFAAVIPFMRMGLERGEKCIYIADENTAEEVTVAMRAGGINVDAALNTGALSIVSKQKTYLRNGYFDPDEMIQFLKESTALAKSEGYSALRVTGEMTWVLGGDQGSSRLMEYESKLNLFFPQYDCLAICQYNYDRFTPNLLTDVIRTHPIVVSGNTVCKNFYYVPTEEFLKIKKGSLEVERLLNTLLERERIEKELINIAIQKEQYLKFFTLTTEPMCIADPFGNFKEVNPAFIKLTGYTESELISKPFLDFVLPEDRQKTTKEMKLQVETRPSLSFENRYVCKDGSVISLSWTAFFDKNSGVTYATAQDITAQKTAEGQIKKLTSLYATLSQCNQAIVHSKNKEELFSRICRIAIEFGGFKMAWIGMVDETRRQVVPVASYGDTFEYLANIQVSIDADDPLGRGPTGTATREGKPFWCEDFKHDPRTEPWHKYGELSGWGASAALPLNKKGSTIGALTLYREEKGSFDKSAQVLLMEMADDISYALDVFDDKAKKEQSEMILRESEEKFRGIFEGALDGILLADAETKRFTVSNPVICRMLGYSPEEISRLSVQDIHPAQDLPRIIEQFEKQLRGEIELAVNIPVKRKDGSIFYADIKSSPVEFSGKTYLVGIFRDITRRRETDAAMITHEAELKRLNQSLEHEKEEIRNEKAKDEALLASIGEGMIATDKTGKIIAINHAAEQILGWHKEDLIGKKAGTVIPVIDENGELVPPEKHAVSVAIATGVAVTSNTMQYVHKKDGRRTPVAVAVNPVILEGKLIGSIAIFRDITKEKELEETRRDLLSLASHQLRTPLSGTKWLIETLIKGIHGPLTKEQKEYLDEIYKINERMTTLVHDMLSVLRMESGIVVIKREQVSIMSLVRVTIDGLDAVAKNKNIALHLVECEDCDITVDSLLLQNVLEGLISNAINYSNPGSEVVVDIKKTPTELIFSVKDSGIGIPQNEQRQIFARFYRASNAKTFDTRGTGLGLYIASMLAKKIGATLSFESEEGKGSTFYIHIPFPSSSGQMGL